MWGCKFLKKRMRNNKKILRPNGARAAARSVFGFCKVVKWFGSYDGWEGHEMELKALARDFHQRTSYIQFLYETDDFL